MLGMARAILASGFGSGGEQEPSASYRVIEIRCETFGVSGCVSD